MIDCFLYFSSVITHEHVYSFAQRLFRSVLETIWFSSISKSKLARPDEFSRQSKIVSWSLTPEYLTDLGMVQAKERGIQSPKWPLCLLGSRKSTINFNI